MKKWTEEVFHTVKPIIGLVHFKALPGDPDYDEKLGMDYVYECAKADVLALQAGGVDGLLFTNEFSRPYLAKVNPETIAAMAFLIGRLKPIVTLPYGNDAIDDPISSIRLSAATGAKFLRGVFHGTWVSSGGFEIGNLGEAARIKKQLHADDTRFLFSFVPESGADIANRDPFEIMKNPYFMDKPDAIGVAGYVAGQKADVNIMKRCKEEFPNAAIFASTGVNIDTVATILENTDAALVGTHFKVDAVFENPIDQERVTKFMNKVKEARTSLN